MANTENIITELEENLNHIIISDAQVPSYHWVYITHITNPHSFYVRHTDCFKFIKQLESTEPSTKAIKVSEHDLVVFNKKWNSDTDRQYVRGRITRIDKNGNNEECNIFALDYGFLEKSVPLEKLWKCDQRYVNLPPLAIHCRLANCAPLGGLDWADKTIKAFVFYVGNERARMKIVDKTCEQLTVELYNTNPDDIATLMALTGYSTMGYMSPAFF